MSRGRYVLKRCGAAGLTIVFATVLNFFIFRLAPGDPLVQFQRIPGITKEQVAGLRERYGIDDPLLTQFWEYVKQLLHGDLGRSFSNSAPVADELRSAYANTVPLVLTGLFVAIVLGVLLGVVAASRRGTVLDHASVGTSLLVYSLPVQWLGLMLIYAFSGVLPAGGRVDDFLLDPSPVEHALDVAKHMVLPVCTLAIIYFGQYALIVRASMLETLGEDYVLAARARGLPRSMIVRRYGLRNAMLPLTTLIGLSLATVASGTILVETVFSWPGIGRTVYQAILERDWPMLQGAFLVITITVVLLNLVADLLYARLDPRVGE
jgi:ABC-type dipeptide/oligopeptide/nickel transport system permease component